MLPIPEGLTERVAADSKAHDERNDCTVKAVALATYFPYAHVHRVMAQVAGRRFRRGAFLEQNLDAVLAACSHTAEPVDLEELRRLKGSGLTPKTVGDYLPHGRYLVFVNGHVLALCHGKVLDWTAGRRHRIKAIYRVRPDMSKRPTNGSCRPL